MDDNKPLNPSIFSDIVPSDAASSVAQGDHVENLDENALNAEIEQENKYGDKGLEAALGSAAASASLGASDIALRNMGVSAERLRETRERSPIAAGLGTAAGVVVPALASGGTSTAAKVISAPLVATEIAGNLAEKGVESLVSGRIRSNAVKEILKKGAQFGTEGAIFGAGNVVDESALGKADLNAQNLVAGAGAGAMLGGLMGGAYGGAKATVPLVQKGIAPIAEKLKGALKNTVDPEIAASELIGLSPKAALKESRYHPTFQQDLPDYLVNKLDLGVMQSAEDRLAKNELIKQQAGKQIGDIVNQLDGQATAMPEIMPSRIDVASKLQSNLDNFAKELELAPGSAKGELDVLKSFQKDLNRLVGPADAGPASLLELDNLRKVYGKMKFKGGNATDSFKANVANSLRGELRGIVDEIATKVASNSADETVQKLANDLKAANKTYSMASTVEKYLPNKVNSKNALSLSDAVKGSAIGMLTGSGPLGAAVIAGKQLLKSDARRSMAVLADIKAQSMATESALKKSVENFVSKTKRPAKQLSLKTLVNSGFAVNYDTKSAPENKKEAFKNITKNLQAVTSNPDLMIDRLAKSTSRISSVAPEITQETHNVLINAANFLESKVPKDPSKPNVFAREYQPSSMEMSKFERYVQAVENPLTVFDDLERGTLTREHVEAIKAVYPALYTNLQQEVLEQITKNPEDVSYSKRVQLGILLDVPTDLSLEPTNIAGLQANFMAQNDPMQTEAQQGAVRQGSQTGMQNLNTASRAQTDTQKIQSGT